MKEIHRALGVSDYDIGQVGGNGYYVSDQETAIAVGWEARHGRYQITRVLVLLEVD